RISPSLDAGPLSGHVLAPEDPVAQALCDLACQIYRGFDMDFMARVDLRMDREGKIYILEANPKPDLGQDPARPSLATLGLAQEGMDFTDLVLALLADRLDAVVAGRDLGFESLLRLGETTREALVASAQQEA